MIGGDSTLSAHSVTTKPDGTLVFLSAPINVGPRTVIGANSRIALGAQIGADCIVLPDSNVLPYTRIPANQVWGGNPATFVRSREAGDVGESARSNQIVEAQPTICPTPLRIHDAKIHDAPEDSLVDEIRRLVADTLSLSADRVPPDFCCDDCAEWDSLAQMAIAAALFNRFDVTVASAEVFGLRSIAELCGLVQRRMDRTAETAVQATALPEDPELIPLMETSTATRLLAQRASTDREPRHELEVVIAATFTADPLVPTVTLWSRAFGIRARTHMLGFNQVQESLLAPDSPLHKNSGLNLVLTRPEDLLSAEVDTAYERVESLLDALGQCARHSNGRVVVASLPPVVSDLQWFDANLVAKIRASGTPELPKTRTWR